MTSEDRTARAVGLPSRWPWRSSLTRGRAEQDALDAVAAALGQAGGDRGVGPRRRPGEVVDRLPALGFSCGRRAGHGYGLAPASAPGRVIGAGGLAEGAGQAGASTEKCTPVRSSEAAQRSSGRLRISGPLRGPRHAGRAVEPERGSPGRCTGPIRPTIEVAAHSTGSAPPAADCPSVGPGRPRHLAAQAARCRARRRSRPGCSASSPGAPPGRGSRDPAASRRRLSSAVKSRLASLDVP